MTNTQIAEMIILREQGKSFQEIGEEFGVSKQWVQQIIKKFEMQNGRARKQGAIIKNIAYQGIYDFLLIIPLLLYLSFVD